MYGTNIILTVLVVLTVPSTTCTQYVCSVYFTAAGGFARDGWRQAPGESSFEIKQTKRRDRRCILHLGFTFHDTVFYCTSSYPYRMYLHSLRHVYGMYIDGTALYVDTLYMSTREYVPYYCRCVYQCNVPRSLDRYVATYTYVQYARAERS